MAAVLRVAMACVAAFAMTLLQSRGCGYTPDPAKGEGEPCTRTSECQSHLTCSGGVCTGAGFDAGPPGFDAGRADSGSSERDAGDLDAGDVDAGDRDAGDAGDLDAGDVDAGDLDAGDVDAGDLDGGDPAMADSGT